MLLVSHSPKLQEIAWNFAKNLDITHKIWSDLLKDLNQNNKNTFYLFEKEDSILNAIYKDKYQQLNANMNNKDKKVVTSSSLSASYATSSSEINSEELDRIQTYVLDDCKLLFNNHYNLAMENLEQLENENSGQEALTSLRAILNVMKSAI